MKTYQYRFPFLTINLKDNRKLQFKKNFFFHKCLVFGSKKCIIILNINRIKLNLVKIAIVNYNKLID